MKKIKYSILFITAAFVLSFTGCGVPPPPFFFYSHHDSHKHKDGKDLKIHIQLDEKFQDKIQKKIHDKLEKMKIKLSHLNDTLKIKLSPMHKHLESLNMKLDSLNQLDKDIIILNDSVLSVAEIEMKLDNLDKIINQSLEGLDDEIELSLNDALSDLKDIEDYEDSDIDNEIGNLDFKIESRNGDKGNIRIKYYDEDSGKWKEIKIKIPHIINRDED